MLSLNFFVLFMLMSVGSFISGLNYLICSHSLMLEFPLLNCNSFSFVMVLYFDWMTFMFLSFVFLISSSVLLYSMEYMHTDKSFNRFILLVVMFVVSMMLVIVSPNLMSILLGWDGLGLVSYCLVIYYQNEKSFNSGMLTILSNRLGDVALLMSIVWMLNFGSWSFFLYFSVSDMMIEMKAVIVLVILASFTKSAQIPFSSWLPAAMAAPTPVSSLVHSSTLVTAGVYLSMRFLGGLSYSTLMLILYISLITMFMAGLGANFEFDLKKIIALSTLSQLGLMFSAFCLIEESLIFFHLLTHALFKALLFMCAGFIIHSFMNCQDIRYMGGLINHLPLTSSYFIICSVALCGVPFFSGFYSKDLIVEVYSMGFLNDFIYWVFLLSIGLTVMYSMRLVMYLMGEKLSTFPLNSISESWGCMLYGMSILSLSVIFMGSILFWVLMDPYFIMLPIFYKSMALIFILIGGLMGYSLFDYEYIYISKSLNFLKVSLFTGSMWNLPLISTIMFSKEISNSSLLLVKTFDQGWFEFYGSWGLVKLIISLSKFIQALSLNLLILFCFLFGIWLVYIII
uniref:NADH-ubiquinone oxidoreductase chain 5 n=1 Tax=Brontispa longissima TaxID=111217 RepID=A0A7T8V7W5_BROLO|nr:NADH dehydrogenase subunit 5 [Brontispa longissima]QQQ89067.1 NADH dehydrogenase subunit 5 [Brontispa longissima]UAJ48099.1 NADH dehydrogenase subunit 5 [Brontispa longissima]URQ17583.1 NADH dehydrogenase subunit 5 [Brontispa longissima]